MASEDYYAKIVIHQLPTLQADVMLKWTRVEYRKTWRARVGWEIKANHAEPVSGLLKQAGIRCVRYSPREPDRCNLIYSFKTIIDGLIGVVLEDDNPQALVLERYEWVKSPRKEARIEIEIAGLSNLDRLRPPPREAPPTTANPTHSDEAARPCWNCGR